MSADTAAAGARGPVTPGATQVEVGYQKLRRQIIACKLPPGSKLKINELALDIGVNVTALREALARLTVEDLVVATAQKGFSVSPISMAEILDITKTRTAIETLCLVDSLKLGGVDWESRIVAALHKLSRLEYGDPDEIGLPNQEWISAHADFHHSLVAACGSPSLLKIRQALYAQSERIRQYSGAVRSRSRDLLSEHRALADAAIERNEKLIVERISDHFSRTTRFIMEALSSKTTA